MLKLGSPFNDWRSFYTTEEQIHELFAKYVRQSLLLILITDSCRCGEIKRLVMGLDRFNKTPCGFCFVEYYNHQDALDCMKYIGGTKLDERIIRTDLDPGFQEGRQYGSVYPFPIGAVDSLFSDAENPEGKCAMSTVTNTTQDGEAMGERLKKSESRRKKNTEGAGSDLEASGLSV